MLTITPILCLILNKIFQIFSNAICLITLLIIVYHKYSGNKVGYSIFIVTIAAAINYVIFFLAMALSYIPTRMLGIQSNWIILIMITIIYYIMLNSFLKMKKLKHGLSFLKNKINNEYIELLTLNISATILFTTIMLSTGSARMAKSLIVAFIFLGSIMFITIQKSLQLYYKQKLLVQELDKTKDELAKKTKEVEDLEAENISISKKAHTLSHKQKSLAHKIDEMMMNVEISTEQAAEVRDRLNEIGKDLFKEKIATELSKTGIKEIDDMLNYMQSECKENKIDFELQLKGNIHHMTNNLISKQDLETLLADHIRNAIIAINHADNVNRSILVKLGKLDETYGLYIYDSGVEFEKETLENLGKKPSTTHAEEGGTGMGFMNTFDTLRKCNASLIIEEFNKPCKDNYTKAIMIKFDNKNEFKVKSYAIELK